MINNVILVGKMMNEPEMVPTRDQIPSKWIKFVLAVERPFKNRQNQFEIDFVAIKTWVTNTHWWTKNFTQEKCYYRY